MTPMSVELIWMSCSTVWPGFDVVREIMQGWGGVESPLIFLIFLNRFFLVFGNTHDSVLCARGDEQTPEKLKKTHTTHPQKTKQKQNRLKQE